MNKPNIKFINDTYTEKYPMELLIRRVIIEGNVNGCLWQNPQLFEDYRDLNDKDFITEDGLFYFNLAKGMADADYKVFDEISVYTYLSTKPTMKDFFDKKGGFRAIQKLVSVINTDNMQKFYDDLVKYNIFLELHDKGFNVLKELQKLDFMTSDDIYNYFDLLLNDTFLRKQTSLDVVDLTTGYEAYLNKVREGISNSVSYGKASPLLNYITNGVNEGMTLIAGYSGFGKTSFITHNYIVPLLEQGEKIILIVNEQTEEEWRAILLTTIMSSKIRYDRFNRKKFLQGGFNTEEEVKLAEAIHWLKQYEGNLKFVKMFDYNIGKIKKIIGKYGNLGFGTVIYDTFKADNVADARNPAWALLLESSKELFQACSKTQMKLIATMQLALRNEKLIRYLGNSCLSGATSVVEVAHTVLLFRDLWQDEYDGQPKDIKPFNFPKDANGKYLKTKKYEKTDPSKRYSLCFVTKNRFGDSDVQILHEKRLGINAWYEIGYATVHQV